jgi:hypothetical protein
VANKIIAKYLRNQVDTSTLNWELNLPPLKFSYITSFHRTIQTLPFFLTFGKNASQPFFNQDELHINFLQENTLEEKFQILQEACQRAGEMLPINNPLIKKFMTTRWRHIPSPRINGFWRKDKKHKICGKILRTLPKCESFATQ